MKTKSVKLHLGCGKDIKKDFVNLDLIKLPGVDVVHDINKKFPFKDNEFAEIYASHILEHVDNLLFTLGEIYRVLRPGGKLLVRVPFFPSFYAVTDPTHKNFFTFNTFNYFEENNSLNYYSGIRFKITRKKIIFSWNKFLAWMNFFVNLHPIFYSRYLSFILPSNELIFELRAVK